MAKKYGWLNRRKNESADSYDSRINHLAAFHAGYAFFSYENYDPQYAAFSVYLLWNGEFNSKLEPALPDGGFMIHCSPEVAERFTSYEMGLPVYVKLFSSAGKLSAENMSVADHFDYYDLYFNGCEVKKPDMLYFARRRDADDEAFDDPELEEADETVVTDVCNGSYKVLGGSYSLADSKIGISLNRSLYNGSYQGFNKGSYSGTYSNSYSGSYSVSSKSSLRSSYMSAYGSYSLISFSGSGSVSGNRAFFQLGSYLRGSYLWNFNNNNNNNNNNAGSGGFMGSFVLKSLWAGFLAGSGIAGSGIFGKGILSGSYRSTVGSYRSFGMGSFGGSFTDPHVYRPYLSIPADNDGADVESPNKAMINGVRPAESSLDFIPRAGRFMPSYRMIAEMGYGLDLI